MTPLISPVARQQKRQALLAALLKKEGLDLNGGDEIPRRPMGARTPLSSAQLRLWFIDQLNPGNPVYNVPACFRVRGSLNVMKLGPALARIVDRHEILRTTFHVDELGPLQVIGTNTFLQPEVVDLEDVVASDRERQAIKLLREEARRPFELAKGPLFRALVVRLTDDDHFVLLTMHHIVSDARSIGILMNELNSFLGEDVSLPELPLQYGDVAAWQYNSLDTAAMKEQLEYWNTQLAGAPASLDLPLDHPRPAAQGFGGATVTRFLSRELAQSLKALGNRENTTLFITLLAAFKTLLHGYTGQTDIVVATPIANRDRSELEDLIGFFPNTLLLRTDLANCPSFADALRAVRSVALGAYSNQSAPFEKVIEQMRPAGQSAPFQVAFLLQNAGPRTMWLSGLEITPIDLDISTAKCDLTLSINERAGGMDATAEYDSAIFDATTINRLLEHFENLLHGVVQSPDRPLYQVALISEAERRQMLFTWNDTARPYQDQKCIHELFEAQAAHSPDAAALLWGEESISYRELNRRANCLAHKLRRLGVRPESVTAILLERSPAMISAVLAVLKAGGAYLPLSTYDPRERLAFVIGDAAPGIILTSLDLQSRLPESSTTVTLVDAETEENAESEENLTLTTSPGNLAYIIYTSGSTGRPKGVLLEHRGVSNLSTAQQTLLQAGSGDRILHFASLGFDASVWEIFMALLSGATLCLGDPGEPLTTNLVDVLRKQQINIATLPPSVLAVLPPEELPELTTVISAGESCSPELARRWSKGRRFFNAYGPTEATVCATAGQYVDGLVSIGTPLINVQTYVLDSHQHPVPIGVHGELYIGGAGVARGYLNRPELNREKFIDDPFRTRSGARLYRTGDVARYLPDGRLEYLGRIDDQIKIRGFRVELGEIESRLAQHPEVVQSSVVAREDVPGRMQLVAYVVGRAGQTPHSESLRRFLETDCPPYMVPSAFVALDELPLTVNGKVDRKRLPVPEIRLERDAPFQPAQDELEAQIVALFQELLGLDRVGTTDDFFELGGTSLLAVNLITRIRQLTKTNTATAILHQGASVEKIAAALRAGSDSKTAHLVALNTKGSKTPLFLVHPAGGDVLCYRQLVQQLGDELPVYAFAAGDQPVTNIPAVAGRYVEELRGVQSAGPYRIGGHSSGGLIAYEMAQQLHRQGEMIEMVILLDTWTPGTIPDMPEADVRHEVKAAQAQVASVNEEALEELVQRYVSGIEAVREYQPATPPFSLVLYRATEGKGTRDLGWGRIARRKLEVQPTLGDHTTLLAEQNVQRLGQKLRNRLDGTKERTGMPAFTLIWLGQLISLLGSGLTGFGLGFWVLRSTGSVTRFALISTCTVLPRILVSTFAGALVDRWDRRRTMIFSELGSAVATLALGVLLATHRLEIWHIYICMSIISICAAFQWPAFSAATTMLVPPERLGNASGMVQAAQGLAQTVAPVMAGILVENPHVRIPGVLGIDFISYLFAIATLLLIRIPLNARETEEKPSLRREIAEGWRYLAARPGILGLLIFLGASNFLLGTIMILVNPLVLSFASVKVLGSVMTTAGIGMFVGSALMSAWGGPKRRMLGVFVPMLLGGCALLPAGFTTSATVIATGAFFFLLGIPIINGCTQALMQRKIDPQVQGRVFALTGMIAASTMPLAYILAGPLADRIFEPLLAINGPLASTVGRFTGTGPGRGVALAFVVLGLLLILLTVGGWLHPRLRRLEKELPDANT